MKIRSTLSSIAVAALVLVGAVTFAAPASASIIESPGASAPDDAIQLREELQELAETQTPEEVHELIDSGEPVELLWDIETASYTAARLAEPAPVSTAAITEKCLSGPAYLHQRVGSQQTTRCFTGTGILNGTWPRSVSHAAGSYATTTWYVYNGQTVALFAAAGQTAVYSGEVTIVSISRS